MCSLIGITMWILLWCRWGTQPECWASVPKWRLNDNPPGGRAVNTAKHHLLTKTVEYKLSRRPTCQGGYSDSMPHERLGAIAVRVFVRASADAPRVYIVAYGDAPSQMLVEQSYARPPPSAESVRA